MDATAQAREPVAGLVRRLADQTSLLARQEARLAQLELTQKGKAAGRGAGMVGAAGVLGLLGLAALLSGAGAAIALVLPVRASALAVAGVVLMPAGVLMLAGRRTRLAETDRGPRSLSRQP